MVTASAEGQSIVGEKITYGFGSVYVATDGNGYAVSLGLNGEAYVVHRWRRINVPPHADDGFDGLVARSATGGCSRRPKDTGKEHFGSHRVHTGVLRGNAFVTVKIPRDAAH